MVNRKDFATLINIHVVVNIGPFIIESEVQELMIAHELLINHMKLLRLEFNESIESSHLILIWRALDSLKTISKLILHQCSKVESLYAHTWLLYIFIMMKLSIFKSMLAIILEWFKLPLSVWSKLRWCGFMRVVIWILSSFLFNIIIWALKIIDHILIMTLDEKLCQVFKTCVAIFDRGRLKVMSRCINAC